MEEHPITSVLKFFLLSLLALLVLVSSGTMATTVREVVKQRRDTGERIGLVKLKMFRPFPAEIIRRKRTDR